MYGNFWDLIIHEMNPEESNSNAEVLNGKFTLKGMRMEEILVFYDLFTVLILNYLFPIYI